MAPLANGFADSELKTTVTELVAKYASILVVVVNASLEAQAECVFELQAYVWDLASAADGAFPPELLPYLFHTYYDNDVIKEEAFEAWASDSRPLPDTRSARPRPPPGSSGSPRLTPN